MTSVQLAFKRHYGISVAQNHDPVACNGKLLHFHAPGKMLEKQMCRIVRRIGINARPSQLADGICSGYEDYTNGRGLTIWKAQPYETPVQMNVEERQVFLVSRLQYYMNQLSRQQSRTTHHIVRHNPGTMARSTQFYQHQLSPHLTGASAPSQKGQGILAPIVHRFQPIGHEAGTTTHSDSQQPVQPIHPAIQEPLAANRCFGLSGLGTAMPDNSSQPAIQEPLAANCEPSGQEVGTVTLANSSQPHLTIRQEEGDMTPANANPPIQPTIQEPAPVLPTIDHLIYLDSLQDDSADFDLRTVFNEEYPNGNEAGNGE